VQPPKNNWVGTITSDRRMNYLTVQVKQKGYRAMEDANTLSPKRAAGRCLHASCDCQEP